MTPLRWLAVMVVAGVADALVPAKLVEPLLGVPPGFCPTGALALAVSGTRVAAVGVLTVLALLTLPMRVERATVQTSVAAFGGAILGSSIGGLVLGKLVAAAAEYGVLSAGAAWDLFRWGRAVAAGAGVVLGLALSKRGRTTSCS